MKIFEILETKMLVTYFEAKFFETEIFETKNFETEVFEIKNFET